MSFQFKKKVVLLISPEDWNHVFVSKHHYAIELAHRGNEVYFLNPPLEDGEALKITPVNEHHGLYNVSYKIFFRGLRFLPSFLMRAIERKFIQAIEKQIGKKFDVIWNFENSRFYDLRFAGKNVLKIYHQVDHTQIFHPETAARTADIVFAVNTPIFDELKPFHKLTFKMPHAFQGSLSHQASEILNGHYIYKKRERLKAYYVGNLDFYVIDKALMEELVKANDRVDFVLIGPYDAKGETYSRLNKYGHVQFMGKVPAKEIPGHLSDADLLFFVHDPKLISSSHKILEYFASGKLIVSTYLLEYEQWKQLLNMQPDEASFLKAFKESVTNIEQHNDPARMKQRICFAMEHTY
jgi:hypothetical protein